MYNLEYVLEKLAQTTGGLKILKAKNLLKTNLMDEFSKAVKAGNSDDLANLVQKYSKGNDTERAFARLVSNKLSAQTGVSGRAASGAIDAGIRGLKSGKGTDTEKVLTDLATGLRANINERAGGKFQRYADAAKENKLMDSAERFDDAAIAKKIGNNSDIYSPSKREEAMQAMYLNKNDSKKQLEEIKKNLIAAQGQKAGASTFKGLKDGKYRATPEVTKPASNKMTDETVESSINQDFKDLWQKYKNRFREKPTSTALYTAGGIGAGGGLGYLMTGRSEE